MSRDSDVVRYFSRKIKFVITNRGVGNYEIRVYLVEEPSEV